MKGLVNDAFLSGITVVTHVATVDIICWWSSGQVIAEYLVPIITLTAMLLMFARGRLKIFTQLLASILSRKPTS
jgi:hypothetical protein